MTKEERQAAIRRVLEEEPFVSVSELAVRFNTSESTIRRDLAEMADAGVIKRTHGGALSQILPTEEEPVAEETPAPIRREPAAFESDELRRITVAASRLVNEGETIIIDSGPGVLQLARRIKAIRRNLTVLTNSIEVGLELSGAMGVSAILTGGLVRAPDLGLVGYVAEQTLQGMQVDKLFLTAPGIDLQRGLTTSHLDEITVKQAMIQSSRETILIAEHTLFGKVALVPFAPLSAIHRIVTGRELSGDMISAIARMNIETVLA
jgi:DeoR family fructose operon transcriptional repressor